jgi:hypothetical protein
MPDGFLEGLLDGKVDDFLDGTDVGEYVISLQIPASSHASFQSPVVKVLISVGGQYILNSSCTIQ